MLCCMAPHPSIGSPPPSPSVPIINGSPLIKSSATGKSDYPNDCSADFAHWAHAFGTTLAFQILHPPPTPRSRPPPLLAAPAAVSASLSAAPRCAVRLHGAHVCCSAWSPGVRGGAYRGGRGLQCVRPSAMPLPGPAPLPSCLRHGCAIKRVYEAN